MSWIHLAWKSLKNRKLATILTIFAMMLSLVLLMSVERILRAAEAGFTQSVSGVDLIVGARSGSLQIVLYTIFNLGQATNNVSIESYNEIKSRPDVEWTIPYSLGDGHKGFRVIATNSDFFKYYQFRSKERITFQAGGPWNGMFDVVLGADVAERLGYQMGSEIVVSHGSTTGQGIQEHDDKKFRVAGILKATGTQLDRALYISLEGMEAIHLDWQTGSAPTPDKQLSINQITAEMVQPKNITSFFLRTKNRIQTLKLQRDINEFRSEPLLAVIPGVVLSELWQSLSTVEKVLKAISFLVMVVGLMSMLIALMTSLNERRREMAILRVLGASLKHIVGLIVLETFVLASVAIFAASLIKLTLEWMLGPWLQVKYGLYLQQPSFSIVEVSYILLMLVLALLMSLIPALGAMKSALKDGLSVRT